MADMADCGPKCQETLREVQRLIDGELDPLLQGEVLDHLRDCSPCMQRAEFRRHLKDLVRVKCAEHEVPEGLRTRLEALLDRSAGTT